MNQNLLLVFSMFLLVGLVAPVYAQTNPGHVVINEVDINPPGDDSAFISEWVELYNPTDSEINLGGWEIASTTVLKKTMTILAGTTIQPGEFLTYSYQTVWFTDSNESVELRDANGIVIDKTPLLSDHTNDFTSWQRIYDGFDTDLASDWKFVTSTLGASNGNPPEHPECGYGLVFDSISGICIPGKVIITTDKKVYYPNETLNVSFQIIGNWGEVEQNYHSYIKSLLVTGNPVHQVDYKYNPNLPSNLSF